MKNKLTVQEMILTLQKFWSSNGCMLMQAYDTEKGAGTMSPYTFLRAIGPEPWNAAYVEPSVVQLMDAMVKIQTVYTNIINSKL